MSELKTMTPTLESIFAAEQVKQKGCYNVVEYHAEIDYSIRILQAHARRVKIWRHGFPEAEQEQGFNSKFIGLMRELEALEGKSDG